MTGLQWPKEIEARYSDALQLLRSKLRSDPRVLELEWQLVGECEEARQADDPYQVARESDRNAKLDAPEVARAAKTIANYMGRYPFPGAWSWSVARANLAKKGIDLSLSATKEADTINLAEGVAQFMRELEGAIIRHNPAGKGPFIYNSSIPGATFSKSVVGKKRAPDRATVLAFHLAFRFRDIPTEGAPMPKTGRPHYDIVNEFVLCALGVSIDARARIREHPDMEYLSWPKRGN